MREIKFRAWDKVLKKMFDLIAIYFDGEMIGIKTGEEIDGEWTVVKKEHINLIQYTGLKDKNGREIYEDYSDGFYIVKNGEFPVRCHETGDIIDNAVGWYLDPIDKSIEPFSWEVPLNSFWINRLDDGFDKNIYENPELLAGDSK